MKEHLFQAVEAQRTTLTAMADSIFDDPELGFQEFHAQKKLTDYLTQSGFQVETGTGGVETAFRAEFRNGQGGPRIGLLCEYDALEGLGHACGHHMQGPAIVGAAKALKDCAGDRPFSVVVYGTPAEETAHGKLRMLEKGCFQDIDVALMMHGSPTTTVDVKSMAMSKFTVTFHGKKSHAALKPEAGRSALDALLLAFQAVEFLREHVPEDTRMHYTISQSPGPVNVVPDTAVGVFSQRSYSRQKLDGVTDFFELMHIGARAKLELLTRCPYLLEFSIRAFYSRGEAVSDAVQARLNGDLTGSFAQYFSNIDFSKFRPGVDPAQLLRMLTWMTEGYMNEKQRAGVPLRLEDILADYSGWEEMFRKIAYKEEYL